MSVTVTGRVFLWAHMIKENWETFAPGFRSLAQNKEHIESETEFDLNPDDAVVVEEETPDVEKVMLLPLCSYHWYHPRMFAALAHWVAMLAARVTTYR